jgi:hypothetical protein
VRFDDIDLAASRRADERYGWVANDFDSVTGTTEWSMSFSRGEWSARTETRTALSCTPTEFVLHAQLDGFEGDRRVLSRNWYRTFRRDGV